MQIRTALLFALLLGASALAAPPGSWATSRSASHPEKTGETRRVVLFTPHGEDDTFWEPFVGFMRAAADQFGMDLEVRFARDSRPTMREQVQAECTGDARADAVVFQSFKNAGADLIDIANAGMVPAFLVNAGLQPDAAMGEPRERFPWWIGQMLPDDRGAGAMLADELIKRARERGLVDADGKVHMVALEGVVSDGGSIERTAGLKAVIEADPDVVLHQIVAANWKVESARLRMRLLLDRYPNVTVVWAANDPMALGAIQAIEEYTGRDLAPGRDLLVGGVDWTADGLAAIDAGTLELSAGGHFMEGAWVMVLLYDYFNKADFADAGVIHESAMSLIHRGNLAKYRGLLSPDSWSRLDFATLSRALNEQREKYDFGPDVAMELLQAADRP